MRKKELEELFDKLKTLPDECEWIEFKEAKNSYDSDKLGRYFSALSNEANIKGVPSGWLVFGIQDKTKKVVGSNYRLNRAK